jgi:diguanylate cyclase (GGDEF)-like protein
MSVPSQEIAGPPAKSTSSPGRRPSRRRGAEDAGLPRPFPLGPLQVAEPRVPSLYEQWPQALGFLVISAVMVWLPVRDALQLSQALPFRPWLEPTLLIGLYSLALAAIALSYRARYRTDLDYAARLHLLNRRLRDIAVLDSITGLYNHRYLQERLRQELDRAERHGHSLSFIMADLNKFKQVNDLYGHPVGDNVLASVARTIASQLRSSDIAARYGGDEFAIILPETSSEAAATVARKVTEAVARTTVSAENGGEPISISICAGAATFPDNGRSADELIECADRDLYRRKAEARSGRAA